MGLFSRSRASSRASNAPPVQAPPTSAAAIAALQAAGASQGSNRLAAGAAAAALRSQTTTPVEPGDVTTKRMLRRGSVSSNTSNTSYQHGDRQPARRGSVGSMASRTFRSPSPHGQRVPADPNAPPVPLLPRTISPAPSLLTKRTFRRPASTEPPARVVSPTPARGGRFSSVDTRRANRPPAIRTSLDDIAENRNGNRNSVNFSRPMSPENRLSPGFPDSPTSPTMRIKRQSGPPASLLTRGEAAQLEYEYQRTANSQVHQRGNLGGVEGSHLAAGTMGHRPTGTAVQDPPSNPMSPSPRTKRVPLPRRISEEPDEEEFEEVFDPHTRTMVKRRKPGFTPKVQQAPTPARVASPALAVSPARQRLTAANIAAVASAPERPVAPTPAKATQPVRAPSSSPARAAHFSLQPETTPQRHEPSRSTSPRKSALKASPSPRGPSPAGPPNNRLSWNQPGYNPSEASDNMSTTSESHPKRKSVRVSFDERPTMIGTSHTPATSVDSPVVLSPQDKKQRSWFGLGKKKSQADESEDAYAPTPALPSFGSVRGKKDMPRVVQVGSAEEAEEAADAVMGVALTTGEKTPSEAGSALDPGSEAVREEADEREAGAVPSIAIDPGTPGLENTHKELFAAEPPAEPASAIDNSGSAVSEPQTETAAVDHETEAAAETTSATPATQANTVAAEGESDSDESHYSDANEESGLDGDGFGSINAIMDSPARAAKEQPASKMAEALPPLSDEPPKEIAPVPAAEAEAESNGNETTTFREATVQPDGAIVSNTTTEAADPQKVTKATEYTDDGAALLSSATVVAAPVAAIEQNKVSVQTDEAHTTKAAGPQSVSFNPRRAKSGSESASKDVGDWTKTQSYWADLNSSRKAGGEDIDASRPLPQSSAYPTFEASPRNSVLAESPDVPSSKVTESTTPQKAAPTASTATTPARSETQPKPLKSALKKTASPAPPQRKSMPPPNAAAAAALTNTVIPEARGTLSKKNRPMSMAAAPSSQHSTQDAAVQLAQAIIKVQKDKAAKAAPPEPSHRKSASYSSMSGQAPSKRGNFVPPMPKLKRRDSSDSDSSFKRAPSVTSEGGRVSMRRSMRANGPGRPQSMAVGGSLRAPPSAGTSGRPMSMRMNSGGSGSLRQPRQPSPTRSLLGFKKPSNTPRVQAPQPRASRFAADSDDDDTPRAAYSSRFDDSDDDKVGPLRPVRGIPRKANRVPSPDLDDSDSDYEITTTATGTAGTGITPATSANEDERLMELARQRLGIENRPSVPNAADTEAAHSPLGDDRRYTQSDLVNAFAEKKTAAKESTLTKRRSIFGTLGRKKRDGAKVEKSREEAIARIDTPLERTRLERENTATGMGSVNSTPRRPIATRENTLERANLVKEGVDPDSWPLPESPMVVQRPTTAEGVSVNGEPPLRPGMGRRHFSADGVPLNRKGNKKRFMGLRRAFGLHD